MRYLSATGSRISPWAEAICISPESRVDSTDNAPKRCGAGPRPARMYQVYEWSNENKILVNAHITA
jgi:hypothetical protein